MALFSITPLFAQSITSAETITQRIDAIHAAGDNTVAGNRIASSQALKTFYEERAYDPIWISEQRVDDLLQTINEMENDGLLPNDYHLEKLNELRAALTGTGSADDTTRADFELLMTDALLRVVYHTLIGKVDPEKLDHNWNMSYQIRGADPIGEIMIMVESGELHKHLHDLKPGHSFYVQLKKALAEYRELAANGGWPTIPEGEVLKPEMTDERVPALRKRLAISGDFKGDTENPDLVYDAELEEAVNQFQKRHGLEIDGVIGPATLATLNVPVEARVDQLRINLERARWVLQDIPETFIVVNIAGFEVYLIRDGERVWQTRTVVGSNYHKSPVFRADLEYLVFNPTWTIPRSITAKEMLPAVKKNRNHLRARDIEVIDSKGRRVNQNNISWSKYSGRNFPYTLRQKPGTKNALGQVKFIFPNKHSVFLHDTPSKSLFSKSRRNFSHGCIRVENPLKLAELILDDGQNWNSAAIQNVLDTGKLKNVNLKETIPVLILYWTAQVGEDDGLVYFLPDIYKRDAGVLKNLDGPFKLRSLPLVDNPDPAPAEEELSGSHG